MDAFLIWLGEFVLYLRNLFAIVGLGANLLAIVRLSHWLGNRGTNRLKGFLFGAAFYHFVTIVITGGQLVDRLSANATLFVTVAYALAHGIFTLFSVLFCLYVLGIINGDHHLPAEAKMPERRKTDKVIPIPPVPPVIVTTTTTTTEQPVISITPTQGEANEPPQG